MHKIVSPDPQEQRITSESREIPGRGKEAGNSELLQTGGKVEAGTGTGKSATEAPTVGGRQGAEQAVGGAAPRGVTWGERELPPPPGTHVCGEDTCRSKRDTWATVCAAPCVPPACATAGGWRSDRDGELPSTRHIGSEQMICPSSSNIWMSVSPSPPRASLETPRPQEPAEGRPEGLGD